MVSRPPIVGNVYDHETLEKLDSVYIVTWNSKKEQYTTETITQDQGKFQLSLRKYLDKKLLALEAPMEFYRFILRKEGYQEKLIESTSRYGYSKDTIQYDTIVLIKKRVDLE